MSNDMVQSVNCDMFLYTDDSMLLVNGKCPTETERNSNHYVVG